MRVCILLKKRKEIREKKTKREKKRKYTFERGKIYKQKCCDDYKESVSAKGESKEEIKLKIF